MAVLKLRRKWVASLSIKAKLALVLGLLGGMLVLGAVLGLEVMAWQKNGMRMNYEQALIPTELMASFRYNSNMNYIALREAAIDVTDEATVKQELARHEAIEANVNGIFAKLAKVTLFPDVAAQWKAYIDGNGEYVSLLGKVVDGLKARDPTVRDLVRTQLQPKMLASAELVSRLVERQGEEAQQLYEGQVRRYDQVRAFTLGALVLGLTLALVMALLLIRSITGGLTRVVKLAHAIAIGNLGHRVWVDRHDEIGELLSAFQEMDERLSTTVGKVRDGAHAVANAAGEMAKGNDDLSQRTQEQASSLEETASSMEEMTATVKQNAANASQADQLARSVREQAEHGGAVAGKAMAAMGEITASSRKIADIVNLIDEIAFQTNLLSLNAAVEAARAGEQGRGFAVVASEVRSLSQRSAEAAKEIKTLINDSVAKVEAGSVLVNQSSTALGDIVGGVKRVTDIVAEIAAASGEQSAGIDQVNNAVMQMDEATQQNAALVEEASAAARAMQDQAAELRQQMAFFHFSGEAEPAAGAAAPARQALPSQTVVHGGGSSGRALAKAPRTTASPGSKPKSTAGAGEWTEF